MCVRGVGAECGERGESCPWQGQEGAGVTLREPGAASPSVCCCNGWSGRLLCSAPAPDLKVGVFATTTCATQGFGVAHDSGVVAGEHPVVAGGAAVAAAVGGSGRVQGDGSAQVVQSGNGSSWLIVTRRRSCSRAFEVSWLRAGMSRPKWRSTHDGGRAAAKISQLLLHPCPFSNLDCGKWVCRVNRRGLFHVQWMRLHHISFTSKEGVQ